MPTGITDKVRERKGEVLKLLTDGCKPTSRIIKTLNLTHSEAFYVLNTLADEGHIKKWVFGKTAIWCLSNYDYNKMVNGLLQEIHRIVETHKLKYVYPVRLFRLILKDYKTYNLMSQFVPLDSLNTSALSFLNHLLEMLYGKPYYKGEKTVYITVKGVALPED